MDDFNVYNNDFQESSDFEEATRNTSYSVSKFIKPDARFELNNKDSREGTFYLKPLERGYGQTIGNALRRVLLSSLPGAAIISIEIEGVQHEFTSIPGVVEDVTSIILNLKNVVLKFLADDVNEKHLEIDVTGPYTVTAEDIICDEQVEIVNPDQYICKVNAGHLRIQMKADRDRGYKNADMNRGKANAQPGIIAIDSIYTPVTKVGYKVNKVMVNGDPNFEELIMDVTTNGGISPNHAVASAAKILIDQLSSVLDLSEKAKDESYIIEKPKEVQNTYPDKPIEDLDLGIRSYNCLKRQGINTIGELIEQTEEDMMKIRNLGKKSLKEIKDKLQEINLGFARH
ncbi:MAG: DNA-directed RNA polymerase subunit alpha [Gammaproteobacteria bacterium]|nr:DNA-directed RNA polymerase subunit alpha [Gammaproteobacteria bacterium]